jgi:intracellular multiplication protein IcmV
MKKKGFVRRTVSEVADVPAWIDFGFLQATWVSLRRTIGTLFIPRQAEFNETFDEAMVRLALTEEDIQNRIKEFSRLTLIYIALALGLFIYTLYLAVIADLRTTFLCFIVTLLLLSRAFQAHFWLFQIKSRKLGCTLREWLDSTISGAA